MFASETLSVASVQTRTQKSRTAGLLSALALTVGLSLAIPQLAAAKNPPPAVRADAPNVYVVKRGDTLWDISKRYLRDAWRWPEIWAVNPQLKNPHLIYPGDRLLLCKIAGRTVVGVDQGDGCVGIERRMSSSDSSSYKLEPRVRIEPLDVAVPAIPLGAIKSWLVNSRVVSNETLKNAPYVLAAKDRRVITAAGDTIYVRGASLVAGDSYGVYREGQVYVDPETKEFLGREARLVARGIVTGVSGDLATIELTDSFQQEVREGDRILAELPPNMPPVFYPSNPEGVPPGRLIQVMDSIGSAAVGSVIAINRGEREGVKTGNVFAVNHRGALVRDDKKGDVVRLPSQRAGLAMVFSTFDRMSYAYVVESDSVLKVGDEVVAPVSRD